MSKKTIGLGAAPNDGTGDDLRTGAGKINDNFTEIYAALGDGVSIGANVVPFTQPEQTKMGHIAITQAVDLDAVEARVNQLDAAVVLRGVWDASAGAFPGAGSATAGDSYIVSVAGAVDGVDFKVNDRIIAIADNASTGTYLGNWHKADYTDEVQSVVGQTGAVTATQVRAALDAEIGSSDWALHQFANANTYDFDGLLNTVSPQSYEIVFDAVGEFISTLGTAAKSSAADFATPSQLTKVVDIEGDYNTPRPPTPSPVQWINCFGVAPNLMDPSKGDSYDDVQGNTHVVYLAADTDLDDTHFGKTIVVNGGSSVTLTVRSQANYAWTGGAERGFNIASENGESISVVFQAGVDINGTTAGTITIPNRGLAWFRRKVAGDDWSALGSGAS